MKHEKEQKKIVHWKVQCNCGIIYNFWGLQRKEAERRNMQIRLMNAYRWFEMVNVFNLTEWWKKCTALYVADMVFSFLFGHIVGNVCNRIVEWNGLKTIDCFPCTLCTQDQSIKHLNHTNTLARAHTHTMTASGFSFFAHTDRYILIGK